MNKMPGFLNMSELLMHSHKYTVNRNQSISIHSEPLRHPELWRENSLSAEPSQAPHWKLAPPSSEESQRSQPTARSFSKLFLNGGPYCYWKISQEQAAGSTWIPPTPTGPRLLAEDLEGGPHDSPYTEGKEEKAAPLEIRLNILCLKVLPPFRLQNALVNTRQNLNSA